MKDWVDGAWSTHEMVEKTYKILVGKHEKKSLLERPMRKREYNIIIV